MLSETWMKQFNHEEDLKMLFAYRGVICHPKSANPSKMQISAVYSAPSSPYGYCSGVGTQKRQVLIDTKSSRCTAQSCGSF